MRSVKGSDKQFVFSSRNLVQFSQRDLAFKKTFCVYMFIFLYVYVFVYLMPAEEIVSFLILINRKWLKLI